MGAPIFVSVLSAFFAYASQLREYQDAVKVVVEKQVDADAFILSDSTFLTTAVSSAACEAVEKAQRASCSPPAEEIVVWHEELEEALVRTLPPPPDGAFFSDIVGAGLGLLAAVLL